MKSIHIILRIQLALGLMVGYVALAYAHGGAMSANWAYNLQIEFEKMKQSPDYHEPPAIRDQSFARTLNDLRASGHARENIALFWALTCGALATLAAVML